MTVTDNGQGIQKDSAGGSGLMLIDSLARQIGGQVKRESSPAGTSISMTFRSSASNLALVGWLIRPTLDKVCVRKAMSSDFLQVILLLEAACHKLSLHPEDPATREIAVRTLLAFRVDLPAGASAFLRGLAFDIAQQAELLRFQLRVIEPDLHRLESTALRICADLAELKKAILAEPSPD